MGAVVADAVTDYLVRLDAAAARRLRPEQRIELVREISDHIAEARSAGAVTDEASLRTLLDRLGDPEDIVSAAVAEEPAVTSAPMSPPFGVPPSQPLSPPRAQEPPAAGPMTFGAGPGAAAGSGSMPTAAGSPWTSVEIAAVALLALGGFVIPVVGPLVGLVLVWSSKAWTRKEKSVATFLSGIALATPVLFFALHFGSVYFGGWR